MSKIDLLKINDPKGELPDSFYKYSIKKDIKYPTLSKNYKSQICIIGAGFTGLSAGLCLAESGFDVIILEANRELVLAHPVEMEVKLGQGKDGIKKK